jgi:hypothetical protein
MIRFLASETFREIPVSDTLKMRYAISNYGRLISFLKDFNDGRELKGGLADGYRTFSYRISPETKKRKYLFLYKLVAEYFIQKTSEDQAHVIHLDYKRDNDKINNLAWVTREEMLEHGRKSPHVLAARGKRRKGDGRKLTATQVMRLKKTLLDPERKTRLKILAKQFGVSQMQLQRIKTGENWGHIEV